MGIPLKHSLIRPPARLTAFVGSQGDSNAELSMRGARDPVQGQSSARGLQKLHGIFDFATILEAASLALGLAVFVKVLFAAEGLPCAMALGAALGAGAATGLGG